MKSLLLALGLMAVLPGVAQAQKVKLDVDVVQASTQGKDLDPRLKHMENDFRKQGFAFSSYKLVSQQSPTLPMKSTASVSLPNGKTVQLTPVQREANGMIKMHVSIPGVMPALDYSVGNGGTYFLGVGPGDKGSKIFLVIKHTAI